MKEKNYPVFKIFTGGDGIAGKAVAGDQVEAFRFNEKTELFEPESKAAVAPDGPGSIILTASTNSLDMVGDIMEPSALEDMRAAAKGTTDRFEARADSRDVEIEIRALRVPLVSGIEPKHVRVGVARIVAVLRFVPGAVECIHRHTSLSRVRDAL